MNRGDDRAEALFATVFAMRAVAMHTVDWQRIRGGQRHKRGRGSICE
ncbi:MAG: hypothetical protein R8K49_03385 [Mariprofundaceae bacterium]